MAEAQRVEIAFVTPLTVTSVVPEGHAVLTLVAGPFTITAQGDGFMYTLPVTHEVGMQVSYVDAQGNPATVDGQVIWASSNEAIATAEADPDDSTICTVVPGGSLGQVQISATVDADLGGGTRELITTADITVVAGEAVAGTISPIGEPSPTIETDARAAAAV
jgi:hypothetical protein